MSRTYRNNIIALPVRGSRPFWKLSPLERLSRGLCEYCGQPDAVNHHPIFGCKGGTR